MWFPPYKFNSFWTYYNKVNVETEKQSEAGAIRRFLQRQVTPKILKNEANNKNIELLRQLEENLSEAIRSSHKKCCCFHCSDIIFGRND